MDKTKGWLISGLIVFIAALVVVSILYSNANTAKNDLEFEVKELLEDVAERDLEIGVLQDDLAYTELEVENLGAEIEVLKTAVDDALENIRAKDERIAELEKELAEEEVTEAVFEAGWLIDDVEFGDLVEKTLDDSELDKFFDGKIEFDDEKYDAHEEFDLRTILAISGFGYDEEFYGSPYFILENTGDLAYKYVFDDVIAFADVTDEEPLDITFLGEKFSMVDVDANSVTFKEGREIFLEKGGVEVVDGKDLKLVLVGDNEIFVSYNDDSASIDEGETKEVGGLEIRAEEVMSDNNNGVATLIVGSDVLKELDDGDEWIEGVEEFIFEIYTNGGDLEGFGLVYDVKSDEADDEFPPLAVGDEILFPNDYVSILFESLTEVEYAELSFSFDDFDAKDDLLVDTNMLVVEASENILVTDGEELDEVFLSRTDTNPAVWEIYYYNEDNDLTKSATGLDIEYEDTEFSVTLETTGEKDFKFMDFRLDVRPNDEKLGNTQEEAEGRDVKYMDNEYGDLDGDLLSGYGIIAKDLESNSEEDKAKFLIPSEQVFGSLFIS